MVDMQRVLIKRTRDRQQLGEAHIVLSQILQPAVENLDRVEVVIAVEILGRDWVQKIDHQIADEGLNAIWAMCVDVRINLAV